MKQRLKKLLLDNWGLKLISLMLAFVLWFVVISIDDPVKEKSFTNIKVNLINTEELSQKGMVWEVLDGTDVLKTVTFDAPLSVREAIEASDIVAQADLSEITVAETVAIEFLCPKYSGQVTNITGNISNIKLKVEEKASKWINIEYNLVGDVAAGHVVGNVVLEQNRLEIEGPQSKIDEVTQAVVEINVAGAGSGSLSARVDVHLKDAQGNTIAYDNVTKNTSTIMVSVDIHATKEIPVEYQSTGEPAEGYLATGKITATPEKVLIAGTNAALGRINKIVVPADDLDISGATSDVQVVIDLKNYLTGAVYFADETFDGKAQVTVGVEPIVEKKISLEKENISLINVPDGYVAKFPDNINLPAVTLRGLQFELDTVRDIAGTIDVAAWMELTEAEELPVGIHALPVLLVIPEKFELADDVVANVEFMLAPEENSVDAPDE